MKTLLIIFTLLFMFCHTVVCIGQHKETFVEVEFEVNAKIKEIKDMKVFFVGNNDTIVMKTNDRGMYIPDTLRGRKGSIFLKISKYHLEFVGIPISWNTKLPRWKIGIDTKPFDTQKFYFLEDLDAKVRKKIRTIFFLENGIGSLLSMYRYK